MNYIYVYIREQTLAEDSKKVKQSLCRPVLGPEGFRRLKPPDFENSSCESV
jgi:hypothetical protein